MRINRIGMRPVYEMVIVHRIAGNLPGICHIFPQGIVGHTHHLSGTYRRPVDIEIHFGRLHHRHRFHHRISGTLQPVRPGDQTYLVSSGSVESHAGFFCKFRRLIPEFPDIIRTFLTLNIFPLDRNISHPYGIPRTSRSDKFKPGFRRHDHRRVESGFVNQPRTFVLHPHHHPDRAILRFELMFEDTVMLLHDLLLGISLLHIIPEIYIISRPFGLQFKIDQLDFGLHVITGISRLSFL